MAITRESANVVDGETIPACVLCRVVHGETPAEILVDLSAAVGLLNTQKALSLRHCVIVPKRHVPRFEDLDDGEVLQIFTIARRLARWLELDAYNLLVNNGALAGQTVFHAHVHLIPKWTAMDGLRLESVL